MTRAHETARAETTKRRVSPSTKARSALLRIPSWRSRLCGRPAPRAMGSVLFPCAGGGLSRLLFALLRFRACPVVALGGVFLCGLLRTLLAVVCGVEARALERDTDGMEDFPDRGAALDAGREGVFGQLLHHVEDVPVLTLVFVDRHPASILSARDSRLYRLDRLSVPSERLSLTLARVEFPRAEVLPQVLTRGLDEPGIGADLLYLQGRSVTPHILFLYHVAKVCPLAQAVDDVLHHPLLPCGRLIAAKQPVPEGSLFALCHASLLTAGIVPHPSLPSCKFSVQGQCIEGPREVRTEPVGNPTPARERRRVIRRSGRRSSPRP